MNQKTTIGHGLQKKLQRKVCDEEGLQLSGRQPSQHMGLGLDQSKWPGQWPFKFELINLPLHCKLKFSH